MSNRTSGTTQPHNTAYRKVFLAVFILIQALFATWLTVHGHVLGDIFIAIFWAIVDVVFVIVYGMYHLFHRRRH